MKTASAPWVERYARDGCHWPMPAISAERAAQVVRSIEAVEATHGGKLPARFRQKAHLVFTGLADIVREDRILDVVEQVLGPDLLVWSTTLFIKEPGDGRFVAWHQDSTYWALSEPEVLTAWIALTPATSESGCMRVVPGSHLADQLPHVDTFDERNLLSRGQEIAVNVDESRSVEMPLAAGEMSLHHIRLVHASPPNRAAFRRIGLAIRYIPTRLHQTQGERQCATLVRGVDRHRHFDPEPRPACDFAPEAVEFLEGLMDRRRRLLMRGAP